MNSQDLKAWRQPWACAVIALAACVRLAAGAGGDLGAQSSAAQPPQFEIVSVTRTAASHR